MLPISTRPRCASFDESDSSRTAVDTAVPSRAEREPSAREMPSGSPGFSGRSLRGMAALIAVAWVAAAQTGVQTQGGSIPRTSWDGKPDLNGVWQAVNTANWDLEEHEGAASPVIVTGAVGARPPGLSVVEGGTIPYKPEALAQRESNRKNAMPGRMGRLLEADPELNCFLPGVPRATYLPHPFQIFQSPNRMWIVYQYSYARREIFMNGKDSAPVDSWMGWSNARWDGDALVIDVTGFNGKTWFDRAGNYHSDALHVVERYTMIDRDHLMYEATMEDPNIFTRPWKISMPLYRRIEKNAQLLPFRCAEFTEELFWGELVRR